MQPERKAKLTRVTRGVFVLGRKAQRCSPTRRLLTAFVLFFFGFQFSRFYLSVPLDPLLCPTPLASDVAPLHGGHSHAALQQNAPRGTEGGPAFQHCKDYVDGMGLTPVQPMPVPVGISFPWKPPGAIVLLPHILPAPQNDLNPPFHPPRHLT